jgi:hypothetical protein
MFTFPAGAGLEREPEVVVSRSFPTPTGKSVIEGAGLTVIGSDADAVLPAIDACNVVFPCDTPETLTVANVVCGLKVTVAGAVAIVASATARLAV